MPLLFKKKNFAKSTITNDPLAIGGLSLGVETDDGAKFPAVGVSNVFRGVIWGASFTNPEADPTREIVEAFQVSTDTFTIIRAQEGTSAKEWASGSNFMLTMTSAGLKQLEDSGLIGMKRQAIINGNFDIWQRATSDTDPVNASFPTADRWQVASGLDGGSNPTLVFSKQALDDSIDGARWFHRIAPDGAGSSYGANANYNLQQAIENGTSKLAGNGKKITISFWARSSIAGKKLGVSVTQNYGTGGAPTSNEEINGEFNVLTSSWVKYTVTITLNTLNGKTLGTSDDDVLFIHFGLVWGTTTDIKYGDTVAEDFIGNGTIDIAQVQVCQGETALPFQPKSIEEELSSCQRYTYVPETSQASALIAGGFASLTTASRHPIFFPVTMRVVPSLTVTPADWQIEDGVNTAIDLSGISIIAAQTSANGTIILTVCTGATQHRPYYLRADGTVNRKMIFDAEL